MSPAERCTMSPGTSRCSGISWQPPERPVRRRSRPRERRTTVAVVCTIAASASAARPERRSWTKASETLKTTMDRMIRPASLSPTAIDAEASTISKMLSGVASRASICMTMLRRRSCATALGPYSARRRSASSSVSPAAEEPSLSSAADGVCRAISRSSGGTFSCRVSCAPATGRWRNGQEPNQCLLADGGCILRSQGPRSAKVEIQHPDARSPPT